ncbi:H-NS histone family protein [Burkholderia multivorans]|uniref:H-NS histone family protein n=1 Tax=Burkholderia multivorans TaxID=87883 RepID=UPI0021C11740|nr:H-NS histone family protein [Burkholderia multivorans]
MATYLELKAQAAKLLEQAEELRKQEMAAVVADMKEKIAQYGITAKDLGLTAAAMPTKKSGEASVSTVVKFKGPNGEPWSGMGRQPQWLKDALAEGKKKEDFAV